MRKLIIAVTVSGVFMWNKAQADLVFVNNLAGSASDISGIKNAVNTSYYQEFASGTSGNLDSLWLDLGLQQVNGNPPPTGGSYDTMSLYLYSVSGGVPGTALATLASGLTVSQIEGAGTSLGFTSVNDSFIYQYVVNLSSNPNIVAGEDYAIVASFSSGSQTIGWAEESGSDSEPGGEIGKLTVLGDGQGVGYGRMELDMSAVPESSTLLAGLPCLGLLIFSQRKWIFRLKAA